MNRVSCQFLTGIRAERNSSILVTGGTGFLGSHIAIELLRRGYCVSLLVRPKAGQSVGSRVEELLGWFGTNQDECSKLRVIEGLLEKDDLGLSRPAYESLLGDTDEIIHCASNTSFSERKRKEVERANIANLANLLNTAERGNCHFFHLVSTAYVAGRATGLCREDLVRREEFTNAYEETKHEAEWIAARACASSGIRLNIYRPSIVYGSSKDGRTMRFNALYYPIRTLAFFKDLFEKDIRDGGKKALQMGVVLEKDHRLHLPIRIETGEEGTINLMPVDFFVKAFVAIMDSSLHGDVFHIVSPRPTTIEELIGYTQEYFHLSGIEVVRPTGALPVQKNGLELMFEHYVEAYKPYMKDTRVFEDEKSRAILERDHIRCPDLDYNMFVKCMDYAVQSDWGRRSGPAVQKDVKP